MRESDADRDGFPNVQESLAGTDPLDPLSHPSLNVVSPAANSIAPSWTSAVGTLRFAGVERSLLLAIFPHISATARCKGRTATFLPARVCSFAFRPVINRAKTLSYYREKFILGFNPTSGTPIALSDRHATDYRRHRTQRFECGYGQRNQTGDERTLAGTGRDRVSPFRRRIEAAHGPFHDWRHGHTRHRLFVRQCHREFSFHPSRGARGLDGISTDSGCK